MLQSQHDELKILADGSGSPGSRSERGSDCAAASAAGRWTHTWRKSQSHKVDAIYVIYWPAFIISDSPNSSLAASVARTLSLLRWDLNSISWTSSCCNGWHLLTFQIVNLTAWFHLRFQRFLNPGSSYQPSAPSVSLLTTHKGKCLIVKEALCVSRYLEIKKIKACFCLPLPLGESAWKAKRRSTWGEDGSLQHLHSTGSVCGQHTFSSKNCTE